MNIKKKQEDAFENPNKYKLCMGTRRPHKSLITRKLVEAVKELWGDEVEINKIDKGNGMGYYTFRVKDRKLLPFFDDFMIRTEIALELLYG